MLRSPPSSRWFLAVAYLMFTCAGVAATVWPAPSVERTAGAGVSLVVWTVFLIAGGLSAVLGRLFGRWLGEFLGLPLLAAAFLVYAVSALYQVFAEQRPSSATAGLALGAITLLVGARWSEVNSIRLEAVRTATTARLPWGEVRTSKGGRS